MTFRILLIALGLCILGFIALKVFVWWLIVLGLIAALVLRLSRPRAKKDEHECCGKCDCEHDHEHKH